MVASGCEAIWVPQFIIISTESTILVVKCKWNQVVLDGFDLGFYALSQCKCKSSWIQCECKSNGFNIIVNVNANRFKWCGMDSNGMFMPCPSGEGQLAIYLGVCSRHQLPATTSGKKTNTKRQIQIQIRPMKENRHKV